MTIGSMTANAAWLAECRAACKRIKAFAEPIAWQSKPSRPAAMVAVSGLADHAGLPIQGLMFRAEYETRKTHEYLSLGIFRYQPARNERDRGEQRRVLMVEVYPDWKRTHTDEDGDIYGPHIQLGDGDRGMYVARPVRCRLPDTDHLGWFLRLARHGRIAQSPHRFVTMEGPLFARP